MKDNMTTDKVVEAVRNDLLQRSEVGIKKYGFTLHDNPLELKDWLQHAYEECLDQANYLKAAIMKMENADCGASCQYAKDVGLPESKCISICVYKEQQNGNQNT